MKLNNSDKVPDWEKVKPNDRNVWQRMAAESKGVIAPAHPLTIGGVVLAGYGRSKVKQGKHFSGLMLMGIGRVLDVADGHVANRTGTKSPLGEALDATADKVASAIDLPALVSEDMLPARTAILFGLQNGVNVLSTFVAKKRGVEIHKNRDNKLAYFAQWVTTGLYGFSSIAQEQGYIQTSEFLETGAQAAEILAHAEGVIGSINLAKQAIFSPVIQSPELDGNVVDVTQSL